MTNPKLAKDYHARSINRLKALVLLLNEGSFADVVRQSQEAVELALKALLRSFGLSVPFTHDLSHVLTANRARLPGVAPEVLDRWAAISKRLRKDRELAFYGSEDITPSEFYTRSDAQEALDLAKEVVAGVEPWIR